MELARFLRRSPLGYQERASEIESYIELEASDNLARGMSAPRGTMPPPGASSGIRRRIREEIYRMNSIIGVLENLARDVVFGLRNLRKSPGFTAVAVLSLPSASAPTLRFSAWWTP